ncbi:MAG: Cro/C1-type helix-turn-helix domain protein [Bacteriophage sp.]|nr:MAG: Cro/C1-type helix-turn-helix domain protein [Bacteriophage sp.]
MENRIKELRECRNISQEELATALDTTQQSISLYESGDREPKLKVWQKLGDFFNVSVPYLQGFETQVPNRLRELRRSHGLTLKDTAEKVKEQEALIITADALAKYERGDREPKLETWQKIANFFNVSVPYLQGFNGHKPNRLKELRDKRGISQSQFVQAFNRLLINKKIKPITIPTYSRWENSLNSPTEKVWQQLADYFEVSVPYVKGEIDREYLKKLVELSILISFPKIVLSYGYLEIDDGYKPLINIAIMSQILNEFNLDPKKKLQGIYKNVLSLFENDPKYVDYLKDFYDSVEEILPISKVITDKLIKAYDSL